MGLVYCRGRTARFGLPTARIPSAGTTASFGLRPSLAGSPRRPAESSSSSYGLAVHFQLLSTSFRKDAVTFGCKVQTLPSRGLTPRRFNALTGARVRRLVAAFRAAEKRTAAPFRWSLTSGAGSRNTHESGDKSPHRYDALEREKNTSFFSTRPSPKRESTFFPPQRVQRKGIR